MKAVNADSKDKIAFLQAMLSQIRFDDPKVRLFIHQRINNNQQNGQQREVTQEIIRRLKIQNKKLLEQVVRLKEQAKHAKASQDQLTNHVTELLKLNKMLADALGSCSICWGEDEKCRKCRGKGSPGSRRINRRLFNIYVLPTLEKLYRLNRLDKITYHR